MSNEASLSGPGAPGSRPGEQRLTQSPPLRPTLPQPDLAQKCLNIIDDFKRSRITKPYAAFRISRVIDQEAVDPDDHQTLSDLADSYFRMLDRWESELHRGSGEPHGGGPRGPSNSDDERGPPAPSRRRVRFGMQPAGPPEEDNDDERGPPAPSQRRVRSGVQPSSPPDENDRSSDDSDDGRGLPAPSRKCVKLNMPCRLQPPRVDDTKVRASNLACTNALLLNWSQDPKEAQRQLMYHEDSPEFHESGWTEIVAGKCINLDTIHSIIASAKAVEKHTETIGDIEIRYGTSDVGAKRITTEAAWTTAWRRASRALVFAFPHRQAELNAYSEYISDKFGQMREGSHHRVVRFDKAVRMRVASSRKYLLSDFESFRDIYDSHFFPDRRHYTADTDTPSASTPSKSGSTKRNSEPCNKWNNGDCPRGAGSCRYSHVCSFKKDGQLCGRCHTKAQHLDGSRAAGQLLRDVTAT